MSVFQITERLWANNLSLANTSHFVCNIPVAELKADADVSGSMLTVLRSKQDTFVYLSQERSAAERIDIGRGGLGTCYAGLQLDGHGNVQQEVCIKVTHCENEELFERWQQAVSTAHQLGQAYAPKYAKALLRSGDTSYFIMGIAVGHMGEFKPLVRVGRIPDPGVVIQFTYRIASTLQALHAKGLVHADVKLANCLVDAQGEIDLADYDQVRSRAQCATQDGNDFYDAPERQTWAYTPWQSIWPCEQAYIGDSRKSDIFALGVAICELYSEKVAFGRNIDDIRASEQIRQNALALLRQHPGHITSDMMEQIIPATTRSLIARSWTRLMGASSTPPHISMAPMLLRMLALDIRERPHASELVSHILGIASDVEHAPGFFVSHPEWLKNNEAQGPKGARRAKSLRDLHQLKPTLAEIFEASKETPYTTSCAAQEPSQSAESKHCLASSTASTRFDARLNLARPAITEGIAVDSRQTVDSQRQKSVSSRFDDTDLHRDVRLLAERMRCLEKKNDELHSTNISLTKRLIALEDKTFEKTPRTADHQVYRACGYPPNQSPAKTFAANHRQPRAVSNTVSDGLQAAATHKLSHRPDGSQQIVSLRSVSPAVMPSHYEIGAPPAVHLVTRRAGVLSEQAPRPFSPVMFSVPQSSVKSPSYLQRAKTKLTKVPKKHNLQDL